MRVLIVNKFYYPRGGDCIYTIGLEQLLQQYGHETAIFAMQHPENLSSKWSKYFPSEIKFATNLNLLEAFMRPLGTSSEVKKKFSALLDDFQPNVVHLNNIHTQLSPIIAEIAYKRGIKVVWTIHDYKLLCPRYDCLRSGKTACELCFSDKKQVLKNRCMKNSLAGSIIAYLEAEKWSLQKLGKYTDTFICPSQFMADKMIQGGFDKNKIVTLHNFIDTAKTRQGNFEKENYYCYVGRLSHEKGVKTLVNTAKTLPYVLKIIGDGELLEELKVNTKNIEFLGYKNWPGIKEIVSKARFMVIPSECYENNPLTLIESMCLGTPVLAANVGGIPELVENNIDGMLFESKNMEDLKTKINEMFSKIFDYKTLAENARKIYSAEKYYNEILRIYQL